MFYVVLGVIYAFIHKAYFPASFPVKPAWLGKDGGDVKDFRKIQNGWGFLYFAKTRPTLSKCYFFLRKCTESLLTVFKILFIE